MQVSEYPTKAQCFQISFFVGILEIKMGVVKSVERTYIACGISQDVFCWGRSFLSLFCLLAFLSAWKLDNVDIQKNVGWRESSEVKMLIFRGPRFWHKCYQMLIAE